jgi:hypothetical protein
LTVPPAVGVEVTAARALLASLVDYAGLFPPASCGVPEAAQRYSRYRRGGRAWMLGSFVVPAGRLGELARAIGAVDPRPESPWSLSVLVGERVEADLDAVRSAWDELSEVAIVASYEVAPLSPPEIGAFAERVGSDLPVFFEVPIREDLDERLRAIAAAGCCAKARLGGVVESAFPEPVQVARFLEGCRSHEVPFKATAGLHHAARGRYPLTYEPDAPSAVMHGFLNLLVASLHVSGAAGQPASREELVAVLSDEDRRALRASRKSLAWRDRQWSLEDVQRMRRGFLLSFGSCSFTEPAMELVELGLLDPVAVEIPVG